MFLHNKALVAGSSFAGVSTLFGAGFGIHSSLQDKTIKDRLITLGKKPIDNKDVFEVVFKEHKDKEGFKALINVDENIELDKAGEALSTWCKKNLALPLTEDNIKNILPNVGNYCSLPARTIKEKLDKLGKKLVQNWATKWAEVKSDSERSGLKKDLQIINPSVENMNANDHPEVWKNALSAWCSNTIDNTLLINDKDDAIFKKVEERCLEKTTTQNSATK
ncbi:hypothetical protein A6V39_00110 [Candidatus Mycoplasma haematobovis]|uniref:Uncharacterized protein n=1 Tax=Candidatus Mycoplasma haematobovis TaxID=432608 RepID=A0A1A9QCY8_9MOLU|nr:hypothetical protein [Candidatus Mycoplasma haematobovis]OAL10452.1 hypothetical protein A6V39_00110 [Candidatus Mycoplasma haematobovis]